MSDNLITDAARIAAGVDVASNERTRQAAADAALRLCKYLVRAMPRRLVELSEAGKIEYDDFALVSAYFNVSTYEYEG